MILFRILRYIVAYFFYRLFRILRFFSREGSAFVLPVVSFGAYFAMQYFHHGGFVMEIGDTRFERIVNWIGYPTFQRSILWYPVVLFLIVLGTAYAAFPKLIQKLSQGILDTFPAPTKPIFRRSELQVKAPKVKPAKARIALKKPVTPYKIIGYTPEADIPPKVQRLLDDPA